MSGHKGVCDIQSVLQTEDQVAYQVNQGQYLKMLPSDNRVLAYRSFDQECEQPQCLDQCVQRKAYRNRVSCKTAGLSI